METKIELTWPSAGPAGASLSEDGHWLAIDFFHLDGPQRAVRVAFPAAALGTIRAALDDLAAQLADPASGIRLGSGH